MSALMDQAYESEAASPPSPVLPHHPAPDVRAHRLEAALVILASLAVGGGVFGFALARFGWTGLLIATWPAFALAGGFGCLCHDIIRRVSDRPMSKSDRQTHP